MPCSCDDHRQDRAGFAGGVGASGRLRYTLRSANAPLYYPRTDSTEFAPAGDLGALDVGAPVEIGDHGGPVGGRIASVERSDSELVVEIEITRTDLGTPADLAAKYPHISADYKIGRLDPDGAQRQVQILGAALVPRGRCGESCSVRHDHGAGCYANHVAKIKIAGKEYEAGSAEAVSAMTAEASRLDALDKHFTGERSKALRAQVASVLDVEIRKDAPDQEILVETVKKIAPGVDLSSASPDYIAGAFAVAIAMALDLKGKAAESGPDDAPAPAADSAAKPPPAAGASAVRADVFTARSAAKPAPSKTVAVRVLSPSEKARQDMIARGRSKR